MRTRWVLGRGDEGDWEIPPDKWPNYPHHRGVHLRHPEWTGSRVAGERVSEAGGRLGRAGTAGRHLALDRGLGALVGVFGVPGPPWEHGAMN